MSCPMVYYDRVFENNSFFKNYQQIFKLLKANEFSCRLVEVKLSLKVAFSDIVRVDEAMFHLQS